MFLCLLLIICFIPLITIVRLIAYFYTTQPGLLLTFLDCIKTIFQLDSATLCLVAVFLLVWDALHFSLCFLWPSSSWLSDVSLFSAFSHFLAPGSCMHIQLSVFSLMFCSYCLCTSSLCWDCSCFLLSGLKDLF